MNKKHCNTCNLNLDDDGYQYTIDELKKIRNNVDNIIGVMEKRKEKDAVINEVLQTEYDEPTDKDDDNIMTQIMKEIAIREAMRPYNSTRRYPYPYWSYYSY